MSLRTIMMGCWHAHQRSIDRALLWPSIREHAPSADKARAAFAIHAYRDVAWLVLGDEGLKKAIDELPWKDKP